MSMLSLALELENFFIKVWPEIEKFELPPSEFCPISGDWGKLEIANLAQISLMKCHWMLQNASVTAFSVSELLKENQQGEGELTPPPPPHPITTRLGLIVVTVWLRAFLV